MDTGAFAKEDYNAMTWMQRMVLGLPIDPDDYLRGTTKDDLVAGLEDRLPSDFSVVRKGNQRCEDGSNYTITPRRIFKKLQAGNLVILNLGYYRDNGSGEFERDGGHYVVATGIVRSGDDVFRLWYRDPAGDENLVYRDPIDLETLEFGTEEYFAAQMYNSQPLAKASFQSEFRSDVTDLALTEVVMECDDRPRWEMVDRADSFIDAMIVISPPEM
jgi:hypothetical protein